MSEPGDAVVPRRARPTPSKIHELRVAGQALLRARRRRRAEPPAPTRADLERLAAALSGGAAAQAVLVDVPADRPPWQATGVQLAAGDRVTTLSVGRTVLSGPLDFWVGPHFQLWARVGEAGPVFRGTRATNTFTAERDGPLELASYFPGEWADPSGRLATDPSVYAAASGTLTALIVRWADGVDPAVALGAVTDPSGLLAIELDRLRDPTPIPQDWRYLWYLGDAEIFTDRADPAHRGCIDCRTHQDVGILQRDVDLPLTDATRLQWSWRVDQLPSDLPEDTLVTHDYTSIALEFDNGQDLSWHWSASLPPGYAYRCPIPTWKDRETHLVLRSGTADLGRWLAEDRPVASDYAASIGAPPERIVRVWLIAVSLFQRGTGSGAFADIQLVDGERRVALAPR